MHIAQEQQRRFTVIQRSQLVSTTKRFLATLRGTTVTQAAKPTLSAASLPTDLACMTWQAMFGSGARIGIAVLTTPRAHLQTPQGPRLVLTVCCAAASGATTPATAARRSATPPRPTTSTNASASASLAIRNYIFSVTSPRPSPRISFFTPQPSASAIVRWL